MRSGRCADLHIMLSSGYGIIHTHEARAAERAANRAPTCVLGPSPRHPRPHPRASPGPTPSPLRPRDPAAHMKCTIYTYMYEYKKAEGANMAWREQQYPKQRVLTIAWTPSEACVHCATVLRNK